MPILLIENQWRRTGAIGAAIDGLQVGPNADARQRDSVQNSTAELRWRSETKDAHLCAQL